MSFNRNLIFRDLIIQMIYLLFSNKGHYKFPWKNIGKKRKAILVTGCGGT
jgi:hypothetical protein